MKPGARFFRPQPKPRLAAPTAPFTVTVERLSHDGRGVARHQGKTLFVSGALPGEQVQVQLERQQRRFDEGLCLEVLESSDERTAPACPHFQQCGGCQLQHLQAEHQLQHKQEQALQQLQRLGKVTPAAILPGLEGPHWHYRRRARLSLSCHRTGGQPLLGFRAHNSKQLIALQQCPILEPRGEALLQGLQALLPALQRPQSISHIEIALGDSDSALVIRHPQPLATEDQTQLLALCEAKQSQLYLQPAGPESLQRVLGRGLERLHYSVPGPESSAQLQLAFHPNDFTQVNAHVNRAMIAQALALLRPQTGDRILDLFCGLGNFTLPLAQHATAVVGVEGGAAMVVRGEENARANGLDNCRFYAADLTQPLQGEPWFGAGFNKLLLDPPRAGALEVIRQLPLKGIEKLLYISCDPATFARDAGELAERGLKLKQWGVMNMFPHTTHVESMGLFEPR
ncbi:MAG TPA: 23S rRNA (uracil(1939)-C(5))-methyltransferase RlmD [Motiliproteus sp.]